MTRQKHAQAIYGKPEHNKENQQWSITKNQFQVRDWAHNLLEKNPNSYLMEAQKTPFITFILLMDTIYNTFLQDHHYSTFSLQVNNQLFYKW